jgi:hypothetical protein
MNTRRARPRISLFLIALQSLFTLGAQCLWPQATGDQKTDSVLLADGTPVHLVLMDDLQGKNLKVKQIVHFKVREDLVADSNLILKTGTEAVGHIDSVSKSGLLGKSGRLVMVFDYVSTVLGTKIQLRGGAAVSGGKGGALTWESALWYGPNASLPVGTIINAFVYRDQRVRVR